MALYIVAKTNIIKSVVASTRIINEYEVLCDVKYKYKVGAIELVRNSSHLTHADLFYRLPKRGKELLLSYF